MFEKYLAKTGLEEYVFSIQPLEINKFVLEVESRFPSYLDEQEFDQLYTYPVPKVVDGACSASKQKEDQDYDLSFLLGRSEERDLWLWRLNYLIDLLQQKTGVDWVGIYRKIKKASGEEVLLKLAYYGEFSRAEFPLTEEFAKSSNNSTVGLSGKAVLVNSVVDYVGPYYQCDSKVNSEFCCPIIADDGEVIGIIDAEAFAEGFFTDQRVLEVAKVCYDLGRSELFKPDKQKSD